MHYEHAFRTPRCKYSSERAADDIYAAVALLRSPGRITIMQVLPPSFFSGTPTTHATVKFNRAYLTHTWSPNRRSSHNFIWCTRWRSWNSRRLRSYCCNRSRTPWHNRCKLLDVCGTCTVTYRRCSRQRSSLGGCLTLRGSKALIVEYSSHCIQQQYFLLGREHTLNRINYDRKEQEGNDGVR